MRQMVSRTIIMVLAGVLVVVAMCGAVRHAMAQAEPPLSGVWLDGTLGAGGYTRELLRAGAERVILPLRVWPMGSR